MRRGKRWRGRRLSRAPSAVSFRERQSRPPRAARSATRWERYTATWALHAVRGRVRASPPILRPGQARPDAGTPAPLRRGGARGGRAARPRGRRLSRTPSSSGLDRSITCENRLVSWIRRRCLCAGGLDQALRWPRRCTALLSPVAGRGLTRAGFRAKCGRHNAGCLAAAWLRGSSLISLVRGGKGWRGGVE